MPSRRRSCASDIEGRFRTATAAAQRRGERRKRLSEDEKKKQAEEKANRQDMFARNMTVNSKKPRWPSCVRWA